MVASLAADIPRPSARQLAWQELEYYAFVHFGPNTFTGKEWGEGTEDPRLFNPTALDSNQWVRTFKAAGMKGVIITAKHHDGFALWPSKFSSHTVAQSPWKNGKGDVLKELSQACRRAGLKMGVYLSPWDRNHPDYGTPKYNRVFAGMLKEVLTGYGPIFEVWFDGANGEGPNGKRQVYDWNLFISTVRKYQPNAVIFSDAGPDVRWVGNEDGIAGETNWNTIRAAGIVIGAADQKYLNTGDPQGPDYIPAECDVSIRPGWFYRADEDSRVKSAETLLDLWHKSVGRGANLLLNVPPDRRGLIAEPDVAALMGLRKRLDQVYRKDLVQSASASTWEAGAQPATSSTASPPSRGGSRLEIRFAGVKTIDRIVLGEDLREGQPVSRFSVFLEDGGTRRLAAQGTTIGRRRIVVFAPGQASGASVEMETLDGGAAKIKLVQAFGPNEE